MLAALAMLGPFSIDAYLPAFPNIQASLHATPLEVQQTLTAYMLAFACMVLWHGALADAFGRRNVVLVSLVLFAIGTMGCAAAHSVHYLWFFRVLQACRPAPAWWWGAPSSATCTRTRRPRACCPWSP